MCIPITTYLIWAQTKSIHGHPWYNHPVDRACEQKDTLLVSCIRIVMSNFNFLDTCGSMFDLNWHILPRCHFFMLNYDEHLDVIFSYCVCSCVVVPDWPHASGRIFAYWYSLQSWQSVILPQIAAQLQCTSLLWWDGDLLWDRDGGRNPLTVSLAEEEPKCQEWESHVRTTALTWQPGQQEASSIAC